LRHCSRGTPLAARTSLYVGSGAGNARMRDSSAVIMQLLDIMT